MLKASDTYKPWKKDNLNIRSSEGFTMEISSRKKRLVTATILLALLAGLCLYYQENYEAHQYPDTTVILKSYPVGETVSVSGKVASTSTGGFKLQDTSTREKVTYTISSSYPVFPGDNVRLSGVLGPDYQITASRVLVTPQWSYEFLLLRSLLAFLFLAWLFNRYWHFDREKMEFQRRKH
jgi:hypothetical protein